MSNKSYEQEGEEYDFYTGCEADNMTPSGSVVFSRKKEWPRYYPNEIGGILWKDAEYICLFDGCFGKRVLGIYCADHQSEHQSEHQKEQILPG